MRQKRRWSGLGALVAVIVAAVALMSAAPAGAAITPSRDASTIAASFADPLATGILTGASFSKIPPAPSSEAECQDGLDNDGDGTIDFTASGEDTPDSGCASATDNREENDAPAQCANGEDDDGDGTIDFTPPSGDTADPGCNSADDDQEEDDEPNPTPQCSNGADDDGDGRIDFSAPEGETADPGCSSAGDLDEGSEGLAVGADTNPAATSDTALAGFPTSSASYAILSTGNATFASRPNDEGSLGQVNGDPPGTETYGATVHDLVQLKLDLTVPNSVNCLQFDFRFLSEEFPEYVGNEFNDAFVAQLDNAGFTTNPLNAPGNFALDSSGKLVSVNTVGFSALNAAGTTYDGASPLLRASTPISPGAHAIYLSIFDQGDAAYDSAVFVDNLRLMSAPAATCHSGATSDLTAPNTTITAGPAGGSTTNDNTPQFEFTASEQATFQCRVDGGDWADCTSPFTTSALSDGEHTFDVRAIDSAGNIDTTPASRTFTIDTSSPDTEITAGPAEGSTITDSTPTFSFSSESGARFECAVDGDAFGSCSSPHTTQALATGQHTFKVRAIDVAGNVDQSPATRTFTVKDSDPPDTTITAGPNGTVGDATPTFSFTSDEPGSTFECSVDGADFTACSSPFTTATLSQGQHTFAVRAIDPAGNVDQTPASRTFTIDTSSPDTEITAGPAEGSTITDSTPTFSFNSESGARFQCAVDGGAFGSCSSPHTTKALATGQHTFKVRAIDVAGNVDQTPATRTFTVNDSDPPDTTITAGPNGTVGDATPTFSFTSDEPGSTFECRVDGGAFASCSSPRTLGPLSDGQHTFAVRAVDPSTHVDPTPASRTFSVDTTSPETTITSGPGEGARIGDHTPTFTFSSSKPSSTFECRVDGAPYGACSSPWTTAHLAGGSHTVRVRAIDPLGHVDPTPASRTFTVEKPSCFGVDATIVGTGGNDTLQGTPGDDVIYAGGGKDTVNGGGGRDRICGGGSGDTISGGPGDDVIRGGHGEDVLNGDAGDDSILGDADGDTIHGGIGADEMTGWGGNDVITGDAGNDSMRGNEGADQLSGGTGDDLVKGDEDDDQLLGGDGADHLNGSAGNDVLHGNDGNDALRGLEGNDQLFGEAGNDELDGGPGTDKGVGGSGVNNVVSCEL